VSGLVVVAPDRRVCHLGCYFGTSELVPFPFVVDLMIFACLRSEPALSEVEGSCPCRFRSL